MSQPRYQIFVSSTFRDLKDEREAVLNAILKLNQFPAGMELFPATSDTAWNHIEKIIKDSDYYVLVIGGKYGSIDAESGLSYTEKEYDFAISQNIPVLAFTHSDEESIPVGKSEINTDIREKLHKFKQKVGNRHHWNYWKTLDELKANVITSLSLAFVMNPQNGWIKAGGVEKQELLERYAELQKNFDNSQKAIQKLKQSLLKTENLKPLSQGDDKILIKINNHPEDIEIEISWNELFLIFGNQLSQGYTSDYRVKEKIEVGILSKLNLDTKRAGRSNFLGQARQLGISDDVFIAIENQFVAFDFLKISFDREGYRHWALSEKGRKYFAQLSAIRIED